MISIVVPTYNEAANLENLLAQIDKALIGISYEVLIVDDNSEDETVAVCSVLSQKYPVQLLQPKGRDRDLSLSVIDGVRAAKNDRIVVMDADLSHPPEMIVTMCQMLEENPKGFVIGSRYISGGSFDRHWSLWRFLNSHVATMLARPLVPCSDPMSGFFSFDRRHVDLDQLRPIGYKIGLEFMVRGRFSPIIEHPIGFRDREIGESKMNLDQQFKYLRHLRRLYLHKYGSLAEFFHFGMVGASGFVIDVLFYYSLQYFGFTHQVARAISFWPAVSWNWALNRITTFGERTKRPKTRQWFEFVGSSLFGFGINYGVYWFLTTNVSFFSEYRLAAFIAGIAGASIFNFAASTLFVYSDKRN